MKYWDRFPETVDLHSIKGDALIITLIIQGMTARGQKGTEKIRAVVRSGKNYKANEDPEHICIVTSGRTNTGENPPLCQGLRSRPWEPTSKGAGKGAGEVENKPGNLNSARENTKLMILHFPLWNGMECDKKS